MTDNEIIKALEWCITKKKCTENCPYIDLKQNYFYCIEKSTLDAIDLINRQQAEIERLTNYNSCIDAQCRDLLDKEETVRVRAIKEFAEAVKLEFYKEFEEIIPSVMAERIDRLVKEMAGGSDER